MINPWDVKYEYYSEFCDALAEDMTSDSSMPPETIDIEGMDDALARVLEKYLKRWKREIIRQLVNIE